MAVKVMDIGDLEFLDFLTDNGGVGLDGVHCHLFTNNLTPAQTDTLGMYTEAAWTGYASQVMSGWGVATLTVANRGRSSHPAIFFANGSAGTVTTYGYYVTDVTDAILLFAERFAGAPVSILAGLSLFLQVNFTTQSE